MTATRLKPWTTQFINEDSTKLAKVANFAPVLSKEFLDMQAMTECGFTLKHVRDMKRI